MYLGGGYAVKVKPAHLTLVPAAPATVAPLHQEAEAGGSDTTALPPTEAAAAEPQQATQAVSGSEMEALPAPGTPAAETAGLAKIAGPLPLGGYAQSCTCAQGLSP